MIVYVCTLTVTFYKLQTYGVLDWLPMSNSDSEEDQQKLICAD